MNKRTARKSCQARKEDTTGSNSSIKVEENSNSNSMEEPERASEESSTNGAASASTETPDGKNSSSKCGRSKESASPNQSVDGDGKKLNSSLKSDASEDETTKKSPLKLSPGFQVYKEYRNPVMIDLESSSDEDNPSVTQVAFVEKVGPLYDFKGVHIETQLDLCDCGNMECPGCWNPCPQCTSVKCGHVCRVRRHWMYDEIKIEGTGICFKNVLNRKI